MNYKELYKKVIKSICEKPVDPSKDIFEPEPPKALVEGRTYTVESDGVINIRLDERVATEQDYKEFCEFAFAKIGENLEDYLGEPKGFKNFKK